MTLIFSGKFRVRGDVVEQLLGDEHAFRVGFWRWDWRIREVEALTGRVSGEVDRLTHLPSHPLRDQWDHIWKLAIAKIPRRSWRAASYLWGKGGQASGSPARWNSAQKSRYRNAARNGLYGVVENYSLAMDGRNEDLLPGLLTDFLVMIVWSHMTMGRGATLGLWRPLS